MEIVIIGEQDYIQYIQTGKYYLFKYTNNTTNDWDVIGTWMNIDR